MAPRAPGPDPARAARFELARAARDLASAPLRVAAFALRRRAIAAAVAHDLQAPAPQEPPPELPALPGRALRLFLSCGETSGEGHAVRLARRIAHCAREAGAPPPEILGLGSSALAAAGVETVGDPTDRAAIAGQGVTRELPFYRDLLERCARAFRERRPDLFVPVDAPALHVPMAHLAQRYGVPTVHLVLPQYWAWAPWRARAYGQVVRRALTILPWEPAWCARHAIAAAHVGHPQLDAHASLPPPPPEEERRSIALLPGSRPTEITTHLPWMLAAVEPLRGRLPDLQVVIPQERPENAQLAEQHLGDARPWARVVAGDLHGALGGARAALAVSGTILIDLLHHRLPSVVVYALAGLRARLASFLLTCPHFASVNLLAGEEVLPERGFRAGEPGPRGEVGDLLLRCYNDAAWRARCRAGLDRAAARLGPPGATDRAARHVLALAADCAADSPGGCGGAG